MNDGQRNSIASIFSVSAQDSASRQSQSIQIEEISNEEMSNIKIIRQS